MLLTSSAVAESQSAFNDCAAEFAAADPKRLMVAYQLPLIDIDHAVREVHRLVDDHHARALQLATKPSALGLPDYFHERYDPFWSAICEIGTSTLLNFAS